MKTGNELIQVRPLKRVGLEREVFVCAQVVNPQGLGPRDFAGRLSVKKQHVGLHALSIEIPVGRRSKVWTSHSCRSLRRTVSPAPPSKSTLSGTTTAARPLILSSVFTCCTKFSCLLLVDAQKSSRTTVSVSRSCSPSSLTTSTLDFLPNGGLVSTRSKRVPGSPRRLSSVLTGGSASSLVGPIPCKKRFIAHRRVTLSTISTPRNASNLR